MHYVVYYKNNFLSISLINEKALSSLGIIREGCLYILDGTLFLVIYWFSYLKICFKASKQEGNIQIYCKFIEITL